MINCSSYFFEETKRGYFQYPQDYAADIFKQYRYNCEADAFIVAHRQPSLMYYTYIKRLSEDNEDSYFGISVVLNGLETTNIKSLFRLFEKIFQQIVFESEILTIEEGLIMPKDIEFSSFANTFNRLSTDIKRCFEDGEEYFSSMSPFIYSVSEDDFATISIDGKESDFSRILTIHNKMFVTKKNKTTSSGLNGLAVKIENLSEQVEWLKQRNAELESNKGGKSYIGWKTLAISSLTVFLLLVMVLIYFFVCGLISFNL